MKNPIYCKARLRKTIFNRFEEVMIQRVPDGRISSYSGGKENILVDGICTGGTSQNAILKNVIINGQTWKVDPNDWIIVEVSE